MSSDTVESEYPVCNWAPLCPHHELRHGGDALYVEGVGHIAQYHCYLDMLWSHGIPYFVRDYIFKEINLRVARGAKPKDVRDLVARLGSINSKIWAYEEECRCKQ